jgi:electron transfer flavoprotein alpha subunit
VPLPAVVTCDLRGRDPRLISLYAILDAKAKPVERVAANPLPPPLISSYVFGYGTPPARGACRMVADVAELLNALATVEYKGLPGAEPLDAFSGTTESISAYIGTEDEAGSLAWIAGRRGLPLVSGVTEAWHDNGALRLRRGCRAGRFTEVVGLPPSGDAMVVIRGRGRTEDQRRKVEELLGSEPMPAPERIGFEPHAMGRPDMGEAPVVVAGGRALRDAETFERLVGGLADALGGAVAASGGAVNAGIAPPHLLVGQTGRTVAPDLYVALGISGADQHVGGMRDARTIVAVNTDPHAPIFGIAHIGLLGDLNVVVPEWIARRRG